MEAEVFFPLLDTYSEDKVYLYGENWNDIKALLTKDYMIRHHLLMNNHISARLNSTYLTEYMRRISATYLTDSNWTRIKYKFYALADLIHSIARHRLLFDIHNVSDKGTIYVMNETERAKILDKHGIGMKIGTMQELETMNTLSILFASTYYDERQSPSNCNLPNELIWIGQFGTCRICSCPEFLDICVGSLSASSPNDIWNSAIARIIRLTVVNHTYTFCDRSLCRELKTNLDQMELLPRNNRNVFEYPDILLAYDHVCNLNCPSCRKTHYTKNPDFHERNLTLCSEKLLKSKWIDKCKKLTIGGDGESFLSEHYKSVLFANSEKRNSVSIMTNGTLFNKDIWNSLDGKYDDIRISVSMDAITEPTYKKLRGGNWRKLMDNMSFLSALRKSGKVSWVEIKMVVQKENYKEMKDFTIYGKEMGFDAVYFSTIWNVGTYSEAEFKDVCMFDGEGNMKDELRMILEDPIFKDSIVDMQWEIRKK